MTCVLDVMIKTCSWSTDQTYQMSVQHHDDDDNEEVVNDWVYFTSDKYITIPVWEGTDDILTTGCSFYDTIVYAYLIQVFSC